MMLLLNEFQNGDRHCILLRIAKKVLKNNHNYVNPSSKSLPIVNRAGTNASMLINTKLLIKQVHIQNIHSNLQTTLAFTQQVLDFK